MLWGQPEMMKDVAVLEHAIQHLAGLPSASVLLATCPVHSWLQSMQHF